MPTLDFVNGGGYGLLLTEGFDAVVLLLVGLISIVRVLLLRFTVGDLRRTEQLDNRHVARRRLAYVLTFNEQCCTAQVIYCDVLQESRVSFEHAGSPHEVVAH